jgi:hypothetical protein
MNHLSVPYNLKLLKLDSAQTAHTAAFRTPLLVVLG